MQLQIEDSMAIFDSRGPRIILDGDSHDGLSVCATPDYPGACENLYAFSLQQVTAIVLSSLLICDA